MKKFILIIFLFFSCISLVNAEKIEVEFSECVDGDTAKFIYNDDKITARFLAIDTPETVHPTKEDEAHGKEASDYTCKRIKEAKKITLEYDTESDKLDKYNRHLVWVFIDDSLLQEELVSKGLASVAYLYGNYKYTDDLEKAEQEAEENNLGIWSINEDEKDIEKNNDESTENTKEQNTEKKEDNNINSFIEKYKEYIILIGALVLVSTFNLKSKVKVKNKLKRKIKNDIKKRLK